ncbi:MAG: FGGY-family carbohydrate kinase [Treponema sp.]
MQSGIFTADIGTSSLKAAVIDASGTVFAFTRIFFAQPVSPVDWITAFFSAWQQLSNNRNIEAICISGNGPTLVSVQKQKIPYTQKHSKSHTLPQWYTDTVLTAAAYDRLFLWNTPAACETVPSASQSASQSAPQPKTSSLFLPRLRAFQHYAPNEYHAAEYIVSGPEYLVFVLTGNAVTVLPDSRYTPAYWTKELCRLYQINSTQLPPFVPLGKEVGQFCGIPVISGAPDFIAALLGTNTVSAGAACDRAGSSEGLNICTAQQTTTEKTLLLPSVIPDLWNISYLIPDSGSSFLAFIAQNGYGTADYRLCMEAVCAEPFSASGTYPATFAGKGRAFVEALGFKIRHGMDMLEKAAGMQPVYTLSGGQAHNPLWCSLKASITGRVFALPHFADAELLGNTAAAVFALGYTETLKDAAALVHHVERYYEPEPKSAAQYRCAYQEYQHCGTASGINLSSGTSSK